MAKLINASICLSDIPKDKITKSEKNGKSYLNIHIAVNDTKDNYGNDTSISVGQTKEEREANTKKVYLGNGKTFWTNENKSNKLEQSQSNEDNYLPF